ncbi:MAG: hypothetical protein JSW66_09835 [Phycisphaerales bacterium]|nr:MAG: hypothetical protein JSW66_09835 [Phycisphaerales bacterium]
MMVRRELLIILTVLASMLSIGCKDSLLDRSLIFSTHTTLGVEASVAPAESGEPISLIIGYKRSEGVINPVYHSEGIETADEEETTTSSEGKSETKTTAAKGRRPRYRGDAYSVIAKFSGDAGTSATGAAEGKISVAQWFATGEAAKTLANQPGIAGAVSGSSEIEKAISERQVAGRLTGDASLRAKIVMVQIYEGLKMLAEDGDREADAHVESLDDLGELVPDEFTSYDCDPSNILIPSKILQTDLLDDGRITFNTYQVYAESLRTSINVLSKVLGHEAFQYQPNPDAAPAPATPEQKAKLSEILALQKTLEKNLAKEMARQEATVAAVNYYCEVLTE